MKGVKFGNYHSADDFNLILKEKYVPPANVKRKKISIPGRNGDLDISNYLGLSYENRQLQFTFYYIGDYDTNLAKQSFIENKINGKIMDVIIDDDNEYKWNGMVCLKEWKNDSPRTIIATIIVDADPFKTNINTGNKVL